MNGWMIDNNSGWIIRIIRDLEAALGQKFVSFLEAIVKEAEGEGNPQKPINKARIVLASAALKVRMGQGVLRWSITAVMM